MKPALPAALGLAAALSVSAVAQPSPAAPPHAAAYCFWNRNITNFAAIDEQTLYLRVGVSEVWRLQLFSPCFNLDWVHHIAIRTRGGGFETSICEGPNPPAEVVVRDTAFGRQSCPVTDVRKLTPEEVAALPKLARP